MPRAWSVCATTACGEPTPPGRTHCTDHARQKDKARGSRQARGYDAAHQQLRTTWQHRFDSGEHIDCWRCGRWLNPLEPWHLGHNDYDRTRYEGPEHPKCNMGARPQRHPPGISE